MLRAIVLGDLVLDVVLLPDGPLRQGTDVAGRVAFRQGGSAATTARWLARRGIATVLVTAVGGDGLGTALVEMLVRQGVEVRATRVHNASTGRLGVLVGADGERSFVADRGAILGLRASAVRAAWFAGARLFHVPGYSLVGDRLAATTLRAGTLARRAGALVTVDLASAGFLAGADRGAILERIAALRPAVLFATAAERAAALEGGPAAGLLELAPLVVIKDGPRGATVLRGDERPAVVIPTRPATLADSTGAGDAFDGGFLAAWLRAVRRHGDPELVTDGEVRRAAQAGHAAARAEVLGPRPELQVTKLAGPSATARLRRLAAGGGSAPSRRPPP